jgi:ribosomal protein S6--L-glutamate ligase
MAEHKTIIGWKEWVSLPDIHIPALKAKVDTGARTSSLHAENIQHFQKNGISYVRFEVCPIQKNKQTVIQCEAPLIDKRQVKSSCGGEEDRPIIITTITLGEARWEIELNLTNRDYMGFRMLLGRNAMKNHLIIDPSEKYLQRKIHLHELASIYL